MGSVAEEIFRRVSCPVLTVGPKVHTATNLAAAGTRHQAPPPEINFERILYATDFTDHSLAAASYAFSLTQEFQARLALLHVIDQYGEDLHDKPGPIDEALRRLEALRPEDAALLYEPEAAVEFGVPADCILQAATEREADLIVLGVRAATGRLGVSTHLALTTAHKVISKSSCPVLTIRVEDSEGVKSWLDRP
jgi:nucleotide-binding universal stress UspA family protein